MGGGITTAGGGDGEAGVLGILDTEGDGLLVPWGNDANALCGQVIPPGRFMMR